MKFPIEIISSQSYLQKIHSSEEEKNLLWIKFSMQTFTQGAVCPLLGILILKLTALPAQISASNFHDLTQITQRRVRFNPKRTVFPCALG